MEDLLRLKNARIESLTNELNKVISERDFLQAQIEVFHNEAKEINELIKSYK